MWLIHTDSVQSCSCGAFTDSACKNVFQPLRSVKWVPFTDIILKPVWYNSSSRRLHVGFTRGQLTQRKTTALVSIVQSGIFGIPPGPPLAHPSVTLPGQKSRPHHRDTVAPRPWHLLHINLRQTVSVQNIWADWCAVTSLYELYIIVRRRCRRFLWTGMRLLLWY